MNWYLQFLHTVTTYSDYPILWRAGSKTRGITSLYCEIAESRLQRTTTLERGRNGIFHCVPVSHREVDMYERKVEVL